MKKLKLEDLNQDDDDILIIRKYKMKSGGIVRLVKSRSQFNSDKAWIEILNPQGYETWFSKDRKIEEAKSRFENLINSPSKLVKLIK